MLDDVAVGVIALAGHHGAAGVDPGGDVAVAVVGGEVRDGGGSAGRELLHHDETADSACALGAAAEIESPGVAAAPSAAVVLEFHVPAVGEEPGGGGDAGDGFHPFRAAAKGVVLILGAIAVAVGGGDQLVVDVPAKVERGAVRTGQAEAVAVVVVGGAWRLETAATDAGVFVDGVGQVGGCLIGDLRI